ncbi:serine/threonine-protein kinase nak1-like [Apium graveolens]|uniref:serine/threonine-protein kinase nak1-like n=1 Tax=Apium graveolens TaxID=4045 RepID=UPI003D7A5105
MNYNSRSSSEPLPLSSSRHSPFNSPSHSAPLPQSSTPSSRSVSPLPRSPSISPSPSSLPQIQDIATPLTFNLLPPCPITENPPSYFTGENQLNYYFVKEMIGFSGDSPVYRAPFGCEPFEIPVAVMPVNQNDGEYRYVVSKINQNRAVDDANVLAVREEVNVEGRLWLVFDYVGPSARVLYPQGASLPVISHILFNTVKALVSIHAKMLVHGDVNTGNIYVQQGPPFLCKLGFGATKHVCLQTPYHPHFLSFSDVCQWGDAPEVYPRMNARTCSSDVWQLGVTAMELAMGNVWVKDRISFTNFVRSVTKEWNFGVLEDADFKKFLVDCLNDNPETRPTSEQLLSHDLFRNKHL